MRIKDLLTPSFGFESIDPLDDTHFGNIPTPVTDTMADCGSDYITSSMCAKGCVLRVLPPLRLRAGSSHRSTNNVLVLLLTFRQIWPPITTAGG